MTPKEREKAGIMDLPATLAQAQNELKSNEIICGALGDHLLEHFIEAKEIEWDTFRTQVHQWERDQYMTLY